MNKWDDDKTKAVLDVYGGLKSPDVEIMLDLLAETKGSSPAMRILTLLDPEFLNAWRTQNHVSQKAPKSALSSSERKSPETNSGKCYLRSLLTFRLECQIKGHNLKGKQDKSLFHLF